MRHYFGYDIDGNLRSYESYGPVGWPSNHCLEDPNCEAAAVTSLRESRAVKHPEISDWVLFDCPCSPANGDVLKNCACASPKFAESYVDVQTKTIKTKPLRTVYVDGQVVTDKETVTRAPGAQVDLKVISNGMPDGAKVTCVQRGTTDIALEDTWEMTFANGTTETKSLVAPAQGAKGFLFISGPRIRPLVFALRGFTA